MDEGLPLPDLLRSLREHRGESLREAARQLDVDPAYLSRVERGSQPLSPKIRERAAAYYEVPAEDLAVAAGAVPPDIALILRANPGLLDELRQRFGA